MMLLLVHIQIFEDITIILEKYNIEIL